MIPNVIRIDKDVPIPSRMFFGRHSRYGFIKELEIGDSFVVNGNTPDFNPKGAMSTVYSLACGFRKKGGKFSNFRVSCRVLRGTHSNPRSVRIWRVQ